MRYLQIDNTIVVGITEHPESSVLPTMKWDDPEAKFSDVVGLTAIETDTGLIFIEPVDKARKHVLGFLERETRKLLKGTITIGDDILPATQSNMSKIIALANVVQFKSQMGEFPIEEGYIEYVLNKNDPMKDIIDSSVIRLDYKETLSTISKIDGLIRNSGKLTDKYDKMPITEIGSHIEDIEEAITKLHEAYK